ncbi:hypothetical protein NE237_030382 [Protea cynaroides]|uniref:Stress-response A/B barrel domain-containing protein n=1 Tax=Protea cynaroides TaxID=273540 RepID=A0A9Q0GU41_9MAGN|nr:hypothetical protein NE237_030382 [Protea cynaroides]
MSIHSYTFCPLGIHLEHCLVGPVVSALCVYSKDISISSSRFIERSAWRSFNVSKLEAFGNDISGRQNRRRVAFAASEGSTSGLDYGFSRKRKVVEHICLLKANRDLSAEEENDMLDYLYTSQYQMGGIVAISLGSLSDKNPDGYTHAVYMRFQRQEDLAKFYKNSFYLRVLKDHVIPHCHGLISVDYESEVQDDILHIFRKGEEFNYGVEFVLLVSVVETARGGPADDALATLAKLPMEFPSLIVQATQGSNFNTSDIEYTHGAVIRFRSIEAFKMFVGSSDYKDIWKSKFQPITQKSLAVHFSVDPVGTEIM